jgi:hypothetical protein
MIRSAYCVEVKKCWAAGGMWNSPNAVNYIHKVLSQLKPELQTDDT